jgi:hypothetical protein
MMTRRTPTIVGKTLSIQKNETVQTIAIDTPAWFTWLEAATVFTYCEDGATFTAQKRTRKGRYYWYAYAKRDSRLQSIYLGRAPDLTIQRLQLSMRRLYPIQNQPMVSPIVEGYGQRSAQGMRAQRQLAGLYTKDVSDQHQLDLVRVKEQLQQLGEVLRLERGRTANASQQVVTIAQALVHACEQIRDTNARDLAILQGLLQAAQERVWGYEALLQRQGGSEVF